MPNVGFAKFQWRANADPGLTSAMHSMSFGGLATGERGFVIGLFLFFPDIRQRRRILPPLHLKSGHALELPDIARYQRQVARSGLPRDQDIVAADRRPNSFERSPNLTGMTGIALVEVDHLEPQPVNAREIFVSALTFECSVEKLVGDNRRNRAIVGGLRIELFPCGGVPLQERDDAICVQQIAHHRSSSVSRVCAGSWSRAAAAKSSSTGPASARSQFQSLSQGSRMIELPRRRMRTRSPSILKALGRRTACDLPDQKILAISMVGTSQKYVSMIYINLVEMART